MFYPISLPLHSLPYLIDTVSPRSLANYLPYCLQTFLHRRPPASPAKRTLEPHDAYDPVKRTRIDGYPEKFTRHQAQSPNRSEPEEGELQYVMTPHLRCHHPVFPCQPPRLFIHHLYNALARTFSEGTHYSTNLTVVILTMAACSNTLGMSVAGLRSLHNSTCRSCYVYRVFHKIQ